MSHISTNSRRKPGRKSIIFLIVLSIVVAIYELFLFLQPRIGSDAMQAQTTVHFIDVGQGDCTLIRSGADAVLIDAGITDMGDTVVKYLTAAGVTKLTAIVATHPHEDHIGGLPAVLYAFETDTLYLPNQTALTPSYEALLQAAEQTNVSVEVPTPTQTLSFGQNASLTFLAPALDASYDNTNNISIICLLNADGHRVLFTGDAEAQAEQDLLQTGVSLSCDVLKVGHHGSNTSSTDAFLTAAAPSIAVISCGRYNEYGHPHEETLERLRAHGVQIHVTAQEGTFVYSIPHSDYKGENAA